MAFEVVRHVLVGITKLGQVSESWFGIQKAQHRVISWILLELGDRAIRDPARSQRQWPLQDKPADKPSV